MVSSRFAALDIKKVGTTITEKIQKYIGSDFAHLTINNDTNTIDTEYVCSTAGKEDYMSNDIVSKAWKQGFVSVKALDDVDNVGAYLTAYLGDMELSEFKEEKPNTKPPNVKEIEIEDDTGQKCKKKYVKGGRLYMYPPQFHIFRWSKGIKKPVVTVTSYEQAKRKVGSAKLTFQKSAILSDQEKNFETTLSYEYYNSIRK